MSKLALLLLSALFLTAPVLADDSQGPLPIPEIAHPYQRMSSIFAGLSSGSNLDQAQLKLLFGTDLAQFLDALKVNHIRSQNNLITIELDQPYNGHTKGGTGIRTNAEIHFTLNTDQPGTIILENIDGIKVKPLWIIGWLRVTKIEVVGGTTGNTTLTGTVQTIFGLIDHSVILGPDGKPLP